MNRTQAMGRIEEMANLLAAVLPLQDALAAPTAVMDHLEMYSDTYEADVAALMGVGAAIWQLHSTSGDGHDPGYGRSRRAP